MENDVYLLAGDTLFAVSPDGARRTLSSGWTVVHSAAFVSGRIWALQHETLFTVDPTDGSDSVHSRDWGSGSKLLAASRGRVLVLDGRGRLFELGPEGGHRFLCDGWEGAQALCATQGRFFGLDDGRLFEIAPESGQSRFVCDGWPGVRAATAWGGKVYLITANDGELFEVDPDAGTERCVARDWARCTHLAAGGGHLHALYGRTLYEVRLDGSHREVATDWAEAQALAARGD